MQKADRLLIAAGLGIFVALLLGVTVFATSSRPQGSATAAFSLSSTTGEAINRAAFQGRPSLLYFGYTNCPEVCPTTLFDMAHWLEQLGPDGEELQAFFFTIDPERDTLEVLSPYVAAFSDRIVGVTGAMEEMRRATQSWVITAEENRSEEGYSMSHTSSVLMVGRDGRLAGLIPYEADPDDAVERIRDRLL